MQAPNSCSVVIVAGSALQDLSSVQATVDSLGQQMLKIPYLMVLLVEEPTMTMDISSHAMSPPMVYIATSLLLGQPTGIQN